MSSFKPSDDKSGMEPAGQPASYSATFQVPKPCASETSFFSIQQLLKEQQLQKEEHKVCANEMEVNDHQNPGSGKDNNTENQGPWGPMVSECGVDGAAEQGSEWSKEPLARSRVQQLSSSPVSSNTAGVQDAEDTEGDESLGFETGQSDDNDDTVEEEWDNLSRASSSTMAGSCCGEMRMSWDEEALERQEQLRRQQEEAQAQQAAADEREALTRRVDGHRKAVEALNEACGEYNEILMKLIRCQQEICQKVEKVENKMEEQRGSSLSEELRLSRSISRINDYLEPFEPGKTLNTSLEEVRNHRNLLEHKNKAVMDGLQAQAEKTGRLMESMVNLDNQVAEQANRIEQLQQMMMHEINESNGRWEAQIAEQACVEYKIALLEQQCEVLPTDSSLSLHQESLQQLRQANSSTVETLGALERRTNKLQTSHVELVDKQTACEKKTNAKMQEFQTYMYGTANTLDSRINKLEQRCAAWAQEAKENKMLEDRVQALCDRAERLESENEGLRRLLKKQVKAGETAQRGIGGKLQGIQNDVKESNYYHSKQLHEAGNINRLMFGRTDR